MTRDLLEDSTAHRVIIIVNINIIITGPPVGSCNISIEIRRPQGAARCNVGVCPFANAEADATLPA